MILLRKWKRVTVTLIDMLAPKKALEEFLNDKIIKIKMGLYFWRGMYYEVLPYSKILKSRTTKADHFLKYTYRGTVYGIRELSKSLLLKRYNIAY